jgi:hypothetical protein
MKLPTGTKQYITSTYVLTMFSVFFCKKHGKWFRAVSSLDEAYKGNPFLVILSVLELPLGTT